MTKGHAGLTGPASALIFASVLVFASPTVAEAQDRAYERGEALAWYISAYVPCEAGKDATGRLKSELDAFSASRNETVIALQLVADDEETCGEVRSLSGQLLQLADAGNAADPSGSPAGEDRTAFARVRAEDGTGAPPTRPER